MCLFIFRSTVGAVLEERSENQPAMKSSGIEANSTNENTFGIYVNTGG